MDPFWNHNLSVELLMSVLEGSDEAVMITDANLEAPGPSIHYVNRAFERMTGYRLEEVRGKSPSLLQGELTDRRVLDDLRRSLEAGGSFSAHAINYRKDGTQYTAEWRLWPYPADKPEYFVSVQRDVTAERSAFHQREQLALLHKVSEAVASEGLDLDHLRRRIAELAIEITGADAAVVEEPEGAEMVYRAVAGTAEGQLGLRVPIDGSISGLAYRRREILFSEDTEKDERVHQEAARRVGMRSGILAPLLHKRRCYGVLKVYAGEPSRFSESDLQLLSLASNILASALFDAAAFEEEVRKRHLLLDAVPILLAYIDAEYRYVEVNAAHEELFDRGIEEIRGEELSVLLGSENFDRLRPLLDGAFAGESVSFEFPFLGAAGEELLYRGNIEPHRAGDGTVHGCYLAAQDITKSKLAEVDYLTGHFNRRRFEEIAHYLIESSRRDQTPIAFLMVDIDKFKNVNDTYGHPAGDRVLVEIGEILRETTRSADAACRWGGEEFAILLYDTDLDEAKRVAERLLSRIRKRRFTAVGHITASVGIAAAQEGELLKEMQSRADAALYDAKRAGRDRAAVAES